MWIGQELIPSDAGQGQVSSIAELVMQVEMYNLEFIHERVPCALQIKEFAQSTTIVRLPANWPPHTVQYSTPILLPVLSSMYYNCVMLMGTVH